MSSTTSVAEIHQRFPKLQEHVDELRQGPPMPSQEVSRTAVIGGLGSLKTVQAATQWLNEKLLERGSAKPFNTYMKPADFHGLLRAKFSNTQDRDIAIAMLQSANFKEGDRRVGIDENLPAVVRARKTVLLGLRWQLGEWGFSKNKCN